MERDAVFAEAAGVGKPIACENGGAVEDFGKVVAPRVATGKVAAVKTGVNRAVGVYYNGVGAHRAAARMQFALAVEVVYQLEIRAVPEFRGPAAQVRVHAGQVEGAEGLGLVEVLSPCPTYWRMPPAKAMEWIDKEMTKVFPLGRLKG